MKTSIKTLRICPTTALDVGMIDGIPLLEVREAVVAGNCSECGTPFDGDGALDDARLDKNQRLVGTWLCADCVDVLP